MSVRHWKPKSGRGCAPKNAQAVGCRSRGRHQAVPSTKRLRTATTLALHFGVARSRRIEARDERMPDVATMLWPAGP